MNYEFNMENESVLKMLDFYFEEIHFSQNRKEIGQVCLKINHKVNHFKGDKNTVEIITSITEPSGQINIALKSIGIFEIVENEPIDNDLKETLYQRNSVAIMFPFIRSQIALITAQPGLLPIMIPLIDVNSLLEKKD